MSGIDTPELYGKRAALHWRQAFSISVSSMADVPRYVGADYETVDDGSAANEPVSVDFTSPADARPAVLARLTAQAEQIGALMCRIGQLERENADLAQRLADAENVRSTVATDSLPPNALKHSV